MLGAEGLSLSLPVYPQPLAQPGDSRLSPVPLPLEKAAGHSAVTVCAHLSYRSCGGFSAGCFGLFTSLPALPNPNPPRHTALRVCTHRKTPFVPARRCLALAGESPAPAAGA